MDAEREKLTELLPSYLISYDNHTNYNYMVSIENFEAFLEFLENEDLNFLGIAKAPYNPYGKFYNFVMVFEDKMKDYEISWCHCSAITLDNFLKQIGEIPRWREESAKLWDK